MAARNPSSWVFPAPSNDAKSMNAAFLRFKVCYKLLRRAEVRQVRIHDLPMLYVRNNSVIPQCKSLLTLMGISDQGSIGARTMASLKRRGPEPRP